MGNFTVIRSTHQDWEGMGTDGTEDCSYYITSLAVLAAFVSDQIVEAWEVPPCATEKHCMLKHLGYLG